MSRDPDPIIDDENPEWTEADFAAATRARALPAEILAAFPNTGMVDRAGDTEVVSLPISREVLNYFRASGPGWRQRIDATLRASIPPNTSPTG